MSSKKTSASLPGWLILMGALAAIGPLAIDMYLPAFSAMALDLQVSQGLIERTLASYLLGLAFAQLVYGPLADRYGRKPPLVMGLVLFTVASIACSVSQDINHLLFWRVVQAFGGAAGMVIPRAVIRDYLDTREAAQALSMLMLIMGAMPILAPLLGGQSIVFGTWRTIFHIMAVIGLGLLLIVILKMRESLEPKKRIPLAINTITNNYKFLLKHKSFIGYTLSGGLGIAGMFAYISGSPLVFISIYGIDPRWFGLLFGLNAATLIIAAQFSARMLNKYVPIQLLRTAQLSVVIISILAVVLTLLGLINLTLLMICLMGFMASQGFINPNAAALALSEQGPRLGTASALMGSIHMICGALAGFAISLWHTNSPLPLTSILFICATLSWLAGRFAIKHSRT